MPGALATARGHGGQLSHRANHLELCFAEMKDPVKDKLKRFGLFARFGEQTFLPTVGEAVGRYLGTHPVDWTDWEDRTA